METADERTARHLRIARSRQPELVDRIFAARQLSLIGSLEYRRALREARPKLLQVEIAAVLDITPQAVSQAMHKVIDLELPPPGRTCADPYEACQRHAAGLMEDAELVTMLVAWPVDAGAEAAEPEDLRGGYWPLPRTFSVRRAVDAATRQVLTDLDRAVQDRLVCAELAVAIADELTVAPPDGPDPRQERPWWAAAS